jgi:hypothetical protein
MAGRVQFESGEHTSIARAVVDGHAPHGPRRSPARLTDCGSAAGRTAGSVHVDRRRLARPRGTHASVVVAAFDAGAYAIDEVRSTNGTTPTAAERRPGARMSKAQSAVAEVDLARDHCREH